MIVQVKLALRMIEITQELYTISAVEGLSSSGSRDSCAQSASRVVNVRLTPFEEATVGVLAEGCGMWHTT